jgi:hypothetical protein
MYTGMTTEERKEGVPDKLRDTPSPKTLRAGGTTIAEIITEWDASRNSPAGIAAYHIIDVTHT